MIATQLAPRHPAFDEALADHGPLSPGRLAEITGTDGRSVRTWLRQQAALGRVRYHGTSGHFSGIRRAVYLSAARSTGARAPGAWPTSA
jgi:hypothetical protein